MRNLNFSIFLLTSSKQVFALFGGGSKKTTNYKFEFSVKRVFFEVKGRVIQIFK